MIGRADDDGVDVLALQHLLVLEVLAGLRGELLAGLGAARLIGVTDCNDLAAAGLIREAEQILAAPSGAEAGEADAIVGAVDIGLREGGGGQSGAEEIASAGGHEVLLCFGKSTP